MDVAPYFLLFRGIANHFFASCCHLGKLNLWLLSAMDTLQLQLHGTSAALTIFISINRCFKQLVALSYETHLSWHITDVYANFCGSKTILVRQSDFPLDEILEVLHSLEYNVMILRTKPVYHFKTESIRKLSNFNFQWAKTLYQNNLKNIAFFFTFFKG